MRIKFDDPSQTDYWLAVSMSDAFTEKTLAKHGISFDTMRGATLLTAFEGILAAEAKPKKPIKAKAATTLIAGLEQITAAVSDAEIRAAMTPKGGWKAKTLAGWGVTWPPPHGWRRRLVENFEAQAG
jgi:hypothetical protein